MNVLNYDLSVKVAELIHAQKYRCWYNAYDALLQLPGPFFFSRYVEGWLVIPKEHEVLVIEHGWIEHSNGQIVDPSIVLLEERGQRMDYFSGIQLDRSQIQDLQGVLLPVARLLSPKKDGLGYPDYKAAYDAAMRRAEEFACINDRLVRVCPRETTIIMLGEDGVVVISLEG